MHWHRLRCGMIIDHIAERRNDALAVATELWKIWWFLNLWRRRLRSYYFICNRGDKKVQYLIAMVMKETMIFSALFVLILQYTEAQVADRVSRPWIMIGFFICDLGLVWLQRLEVCHMTNAIKSALYFQYFCHKSIHSKRHLRAFSMHLVIMKLFRETRNEYKENSIVNPFETWLQSKES